MKERANPANPHGEGIYMVAFETDDPEAFAKGVETAGGRITRRPDESQFVWVHPTSSNFVFMEIRPRSS